MGQSVATHRFLIYGNTLSIQGIGVTIVFGTFHVKSKTRPWVSRAQQGRAAATADSSSTAIPARTGQAPPDPVAWRAWRSTAPRFRPPPRQVGSPQRACPASFFGCMRRDAARPSLTRSCARNVTVFGASPLPPTSKQGRHRLRNRIQAILLAEENRAAAPRHADRLQREMPSASPGEDFISRSCSMRRSSSTSPPDTVSSRPTIIPLAPA